MLTQPNMVAPIIGEYGMSGRNEWGKKEYGENELNEARALVWVGSLFSLFREAPLI